MDGQEVRNGLIVGRAKHKGMPVTGQKMSCGKSLVDIGFFDDYKGYDQRLQRIRSKRSLPDKTHLFGKDDVLASTRSFALNKVLGLNATGIQGLYSIRVSTLFKRAGEKNIVQNVKIIPVDIASGHSASFRAWNQARLRKPGCSIYHGCVRWVNIVRC